MEKHEAVTLETVLGLLQKLSAFERLKLVEHVLVELEPIVAEKESKKLRSLRGVPKGHPLTAEETREIERKLWEKADVERPRRVVQLGGLWKDMPFDVSSDDIRQVRRELSETLQRRAEGL
jgi:hypothetical protein